MNHQSCSILKLVETAKAAMASIFVTCTFGEGEFPETMLNLWSHLEDKCDKHTFPESSLRYGVFGLGSSMYAVGDQFNRAARRLDARLEELGGERLIEVGLGDDQAAELYRGALDTWMEKLQPKLFGKASGERSYLDPPEPLFRLSVAVSSNVVVSSQSLNFSCRLISYPFITTI
jgi:sulfite reductase (NADPH) hemoprotein beta-component